MKGWKGRRGFEGGGDEDDCAADSGVLHVEVLDVSGGGVFLTCACRGGSINVTSWKLPNVVGQ